MIMAGIVLYNPDIKRLEENLNAICAQVKEVILIDNNSNNLVDIEKIILSYNNISILRNDVNKGIATALNQIISYTDSKGYEWVITLDQDSVCFDGLIKSYEEFCNMERIGMMTCNIIDRNFALESKNSKMEPYTFVKTCITSGCLTNVKACMEVGGFDESLFIDYVDFDMCTTMLENGYKIIKVNFDGILHEVGLAYTRNFCGKTEVIYNHSAFRKYYISRNGIYYARKHKASLNFMNSYLQAYKSLVLSLIFEDQKLKKLKANLKGLLDGHIMKICN
jgi:rhamnosyltransferase